MPPKKTPKKLSRARERLAAVRERVLTTPAAGEQSGSSSTSSSTPISLPARLPKLMRDEIKGWTATEWDDHLRQLDGELAKYRSLYPEPALWLEVDLEVAGYHLTEARDRLDQLRQATGSTTSLGDPTVDGVIRKRFLKATADAHNSLDDLFDHHPLHGSVLVDQRTGEQIGAEDDTRTASFGRFDHPERGQGIYRYVGDERPEPANDGDEQRYRKLLEHETTAKELRERVAADRGAVTMRSELKSKSAGAEKLRELLGQPWGGTRHLTRRMSAEEAKQVAASGGAIVAKQRAAKWVTIGSTANIEHAGRTQHGVRVTWTVDESFRKLLLSPHVNIYNESEVQASSYREPYWVWKDNEVGNIALSPVLIEVANGMSLGHREGRAAPSSSSRKPVRR